MTFLGRTLRSSIGRKQVVAVTGLGLCLFLVGHLGGNLLLLEGHEAFDAYAHALSSNPLLVPIEIALLAVFLLHLGLALKTNLENRGARSTRYVARGDSGKKTFAASTMVPSGIIILVFVVFHLLHFKVAYMSGDRPAATIPGVEGTVEGSLYVLVVHFFQSSWFAVVWYVFSVCVLGLHVSHGLQSAFQTLGVNHPRYTPCLKLASIGFGIVIAVGYAILPIYCCFVDITVLAREATP